MRLTKAKKLAVSSAISSAVQSKKIKVTAKLTSSKEATVSAEGQHEFIARVTEDINVKGTSTEISGLSQVENHTETINQNGTMVYRAYTLIRVPKENPQEPPGAFYYLGRSAIAPGWAQFLKGHDTRAWAIIAGEVILVPAAIASILIHNDASNKATISTKQSNRDFYNDRARLAYGVFLGTAAAAITFYTYNLVDAVISDDLLHLAYSPTSDGGMVVARFDF